MLKSMVNRASNTSLNHSPEIPVLEMNLPTREECEGWDQGQMSAFMYEMKMYECAGTVNRYQINGHRFLNMTESDLRKFSLILQPQLQKIVQDIKKNDGSILNKLRRLKSKPVPRIPARDYRDEEREDDEGSDPEYDNETYAAPDDDSYEPPPSHHHRVFSSAPIPQGEYLAVLHNRPAISSRPERPPKKPLRPGQASKQLPPTPRPNHPHQQQQNDEDYINPDSSNDEDYVEPDENPPHRGRALRDLPKVPPVLTQRPSSPECYEVPDKEVKPHTPPIVNRLCPVPSPQPHLLPPKPSPRLPKRSPTTVQEPTAEDEYEVCDSDNSCSDKPTLAPPLLRPKPLPRERSPKLALKPKLPEKPSQKESDNVRTLPVTTSEPPPTPSKGYSLDLKRPKIPIPHFTSHKITDRGHRDNTENGLTDQDKEAELRLRPWFASSCDRKTADDALFQSNQDGSFLVRKSSGHDAQQPYTLVVFYNGRVYNIPIRYLPSTQQYALGRKKNGEEYFSSVSHIIEHHQRTGLVLIDSQSNNKDATRLTFPVRP